MSETAGARVVRGQIVIPEGIEPKSARTVLVRVEDVSRADAPSVVVAEQKLEDVQLRPGSRLPFQVTVRASAIDERGRYAVSVHVDISGSAEVERGDLISTQSHPVLTWEGGDDVTVPVRQV